jgi:hypothetical protein
MQVGSFAISAERHGVDDSPGALVAVRDSGVGIAPEHYTNV